MLSVLIVEDEPKVGQLIRALIHWDELGMELSGIVDNGKDALDIILLSPPDIVITDIRMPLIDGLELIHQVRNHDLPVKFIVISGYRHFEYAHRAIKYGIEDYLLKPINENELNSILLKISNEKTHEIEQKKSERNRLQVLSKSRNLLHRELLEKIIDRSKEVMDIHRVNNEYSVHFTDAYFQAFAIKLDHKNPVNIDLTQSSLITEKILEIIETQLEPLALANISIVRELGLILSILNFEDANRIAVTKSYGSLLGAIQDYIFAYKEYEVSLGIGKIAQQFNQLHDSLIASMKAIQYRIVLGVGEKIHYDEHKFETFDIAAKIIPTLKIGLPRCIESFDSLELKVKISDAFRSLSDKYNADPGLYYELAEEIIRIFFDNVQFVDQKQITKEKRNLQHQIHNIYTRQAMTRCLEENLGVLLDTYREQQISQTKKPIRDAKSYLEEHYMEKVSLEDLAKIVNLNPVYFSVIFKKETGNNFSDYLINLRMEAAKALLRETTLTMMAIAIKVGYEDAKYFSQLFRKKVGVNPAVYRKLYS